MYRPGNGAQTFCGSKCRQTRGGGVTIGPVPPPPDGENILVNVLHVLLLTLGLADGFPITLFVSLEERRVYIEARDNQFEARRCDQRNCSRFGHEMGLSKKGPVVEWARHGSFR